MTQPIAIATPRRSRHPAIDARSFVCFRLVPADSTMVALELHHPTARLFAFAR